jgi:hypothetical protein
MSHGSGSPTACLFRLHFWHLADPWHICLFPQSSGFVQSFNKTEIQKDLIIDLHNLYKFSPSGASTGTPSPNLLVRFKHRPTHFAPAPELTSKGSPPSKRGFNQRKSTRRTNKFNPFFPWDPEDTHQVSSKETEKNEMPTGVATPLFKVAWPLLSKSSAT